MSGGVWQRLGGIREAVKEGLQEFGRDALRETTLIKASVVENVTPVTNVLGKTPLLGGNRRREESNEIGNRRPGFLSSSSRDDEEGAAWDSSDIDLSTSGGVLKFKSIPLQSPAEAQEKASEHEGWNNLSSLETHVEKVPEREAGAHGDSSDIPTQEDPPPDEAAANVEEKGYSLEMFLVGASGAGEDLKRNAEISGQVAGSGNARGQGMEEGTISMGGFGPQGGGADLATPGALQGEVRVPEGQVANALSASRDVPDGGTPPPDGHDGVKSRQTGVDGVELEGQGEGGGEVGGGQRGVIIEQQVKPADSVREEKDETGDLVRKEEDKIVAAGKKEVETKEREMEELKNLCDQLKVSLEEALQGRAGLLHQLAELEDDLEAARVQGTRHGLELEQLQALKGSVRQLEGQVAARDNSLAQAKKEREAFEQRQKSAAAALEKKISALNKQLEEAEKEAEEMQEENDSMEAAYSDLKEMLEEAVAEKEAAQGAAAQMQRQLDACRVSLAKAEAEAKAARREVLEGNMALANAKAELWAANEAAKGQALGEDERKELEGALKAMSASCQLAATETAKWREQAEAAKEEVSTMARQVAAVQADAEVLQQRVQEAEELVEEAQRLRAEAEGTSEQLREQTERRAKIFNAAVKAAVAKIQLELEGERDAAIERHLALEAEAAHHAQEMGQAQAAMRALEGLLEEVNTQHAELAERHQHGLKEIAALERQLAAAHEREKEATKQLHGAMEANAAAAEKVAEVEEKREELQLALEELQQESGSRHRGHLAECERLKSRIVAVENEKISLEVAAQEASSRAAEEASALRTRVSNLEARLDSRGWGLDDSSSAGRQSQERVRASKAAAGGGSGSSAASAKSALEGLGLGDKKSDGRVIDIEASGSDDQTALARRRAARASGRQVSPSSSWLKRATFEEHERVPGRISRRTFILICYFMLLHIMVMVSFTRQSHPTCNRDELAVDRLPGF